MDLVGSYRWRRWHAGRHDIARQGLRQVKSACAHKLGRESVENIAAIELLEDGCTKGRKA